MGAHERATVIWLYVSMSLCACLVVFLLVCTCVRVYVCMCVCVLYLVCTYFCSVYMCVCVGMCIYPAYMCLCVLYMACAELLVLFSQASACLMWADLRIAPSLVCLHVASAAICAATHTFVLVNPPAVSAVPTRTTPGVVQYYMQKDLKVTLPFHYRVSPHRTIL